MATTFVHIGDFHAGPGPRNVDRYRALDQIIDEARAITNLGAWLWPGDLNHARMTIEDRNALAQRLVFMANRAPVVMVYGNHDLPGDLDVFAKLKAGFPLYVIDTPKTIALRLATGEAASIFGLPYPQKAGMVPTVAPGAVVDTAADLLEPIFMQAAADLQAAIARGHVPLMIGHVNVAGSRTSTGQPNIGREIELSPRHLDRLGCIYKGLNHIHKAQEIAGAHYAGSVCRLSWGEIEEKRYVVITFGQTAGHLCWKVESKPLAVPAMYHVEGDLTREGFTWAVKAGPGGDVQPAPASWKGAEVRVRYRFKQSEKTVLSEALIYAEFADAARLELEPLAVPDRTLRAPEVVTAPTLERKLAAYAQLDALAPSLADKLAMLQRADLLSVLSQVQTALAQLEAGEEASVAA